MSGIEGEDYSAEGNLVRCVILNVLTQTKYGVFGMYKMMHYVVKWLGGLLSGWDCVPGGGEGDYMQWGFCLHTT